LARIEKEKILAGKGGGDLVTLYLNHWEDCLGQGEIWAKQDRQSRYSRGGEDIAEKRITGARSGKLQSSKGVGAISRSQQRREII